MCETVRTPKAITWGKGRIGYWGAALALTLPGLVAAEPMFYAEGGATPTHSTAQVASVGVLLPIGGLAWLPRKAGPLTLHADLAVRHWRTNHHHGGRRGLTQWLAQGVWRYPLGRAQTPWFIELGAGVSVFDGHYQARHRRFSTRFQFVESVGVGYRLGTSRPQEISLRYQHISNAGIRSPNPGEDLVMLRWAWQF